MIEINKYVKKLQIIGVNEFQAKSFLFDLQNELKENNSFDLIKNYNKLKSFNVKDEDARHLLDEIGKETGSKIKISLVDKIKLKFDDSGERRKLLILGFVIVGAWWLFQVYVR